MTMFRPKGNIAEETHINISEEDKKLVNSEFNLNRIAEIQKSWTTGTQALVRDGRVYVREGTLQKLCRKGNKPRHLFLFNDILVYGTTIAKGKYAHQHVMALEDMSVTDVQDTEDALNGFQINHHKKSFLVYAPSLTDKSNWLTNLRKYIKLASDRDVDEEVDARAVWIPDSKVRVCMCCQQVEFSLLQRKHHCRNCGKVVCHACSSFKAILNKGRAERVCMLCHAKLGGNAPGDVPVAGVASTERGTLVVPAPLTPKAEPKQRGQPEGSDNSSDSSDESDTEGNTAAMGGSVNSVSAVKSFISGSTAGTAAASPAAAVPVARPRPTPKLRKEASLTSDEKKMHELSNEERMAIMMMVKEGQLTMDQALDKIAKGEKPTKSPAKPSAPATEAQEASISTSVTKTKPLLKPNEKPPPRPSVPPASAPRASEGRRPSQPSLLGTASSSSSSSSISKPSGTELQAEPPSTTDDAASKRKGRRRTFKSPKLQAGEGKNGNEGEEEREHEGDGVVTKEAESSRLSMADNNAGERASPEPGITAAPRKKRRQFGKQPPSDPPTEVGEAALPEPVEPGEEATDGLEEDAEVVSARQRRAEREARRQLRQKDRSEEDSVAAPGEVGDEPEAGDEPETVEEAPRQPAGRKSKRRAFKPAGGTE